MLGLNEISQLLENSPQGFLKPDHVLFTENNSRLLKKHNKLGAISNKDEILGEAIGGAQTNIFCNVFGCIAAFDNIASYQSHYNAMHRFVCAECKKSFPTDHFLDLHISENHDSYFMARLERGERLFKCYLEECKEVFGNLQERKEHCIKHHKFPTNFRFDQIAFKTCLKKQIPSIKKENQEMEVDGETKAENRSQEHKTISFGHQKEKTFCPRKTEADKPLDNMNSLKQAIDTV